MAEKATETVGESTGGASADASGGSDGGAGASDGKAPASSAAAPTTLAEIAERLGMDPAALYAVAIPTGRGDGSTETLGALKDRALKAQGLEVERLAWERERDGGRSELAKARAELQDLLAILPPAALAPATLQALRDRQERARGEQMRLLLAAEPSWRDERAYQQDLASIVALAADYGFSSEDVQSVVDHRLMRLLAGYARMRRAAADVLTKVKSREKRAGADAPAIGDRGARASTRREPTGRAQQVSEIAKLLGG